MKRVLFVTNGHGEQAIAARIARELDTVGGIEIDHLSLVGDDVAASRSFRSVGPQRTLPSGGLIAMGNVRNVIRDVRAGLLPHTFAQLRFLHGVRGRYDLVVAVGDAFAYGMARRARAAKTVFVGTAKSVHVARYGSFESRMLRSADSIFVRDEITADDLRRRGVPAGAPGNVIVDLFDEPDATGAQALAGKTVAIFPGSRQSAYDDAVFACAIMRTLVQRIPAIEAALSVAPGLDHARFAQVLQEDRWDVTVMESTSIPFVLSFGGAPVVTAWAGSPGAMLANATLVLGQAGTANEAAAARGIPIAAFERDPHSGGAWYRRRQRGLLDGALAILPRSLDAATNEVAALLLDGARRGRMAAIGRERMGAPGGARKIAAHLRERLQC